MGCEKNKSTLSCTAPSPCLSQCLTILPRSKHRLETTLETLQTTAQCGRKLEKKEKNYNDREPSAENSLDELDSVGFIFNCILPIDLFTDPAK